MRFVQSKNKIIVREKGQRDIVIPSDKYPLTASNYPIKVFAEHVTEDCTDDYILQIYDHTKVELGRCYDNTGRLLLNLLANGYGKRIRAYAGWGFMNGQSYPFHHSFVVVDGKYVFDSIPLIAADDSNSHETKGMNENELRDWYAAKIREKMSQPNTLAYGKGKIKPGVLYIAQECNPVDAERIVRKLLNKYPKHVAFISADENTGHTDMQKRILGE